MTAKPIPDGYHTVTPYLIVEGADGLISFMKEAFGAESRGDAFRTPDGKITHAELEIGDSVVMLADAGVSPDARVMTAMLHLYVEDCDATFKKAVAAGATPEREPADQFYGDRSGGVRDAFGNVWYISTHVEDVPPEEMARRAMQAAAQSS
jgi:uncharacterized glyoxalase superfamily protein PhnB